MNGRIVVDVRSIPLERGGGCHLLHRPLLLCVLLLGLCFINVQSLENSICFSIPVSLNNITTCSNLSCQSNVVFETVVPAVSGSSSCSQIVPPSANSAPIRYNVTVDTADFLYAADGAYNTDDVSYTSNHDFCFPLGCSAGCNGNTVDPSGDGPVFCKERGIMFPITCPFNPFGPPSCRVDTAFKIRLDGPPGGYRVIKTSRSGNLGMSITITSDSLSKPVSLQYFGSPVAVDVGNGTMVSINSDNVRAPDGPSYVILDHTTNNKDAAYAVPDSYVNPPGMGLSAQRVGWYQNVNNVKTYAPDVGNYWSYEVADPGVIKSNERYTVSTTWASIKQFLKDNQQYLLKARYPGATVASPYTKSPALVALNSRSLLDNFAGVKMPWNIAFQDNICRVFEWESAYLSPISNNLTQYSTAQTIPFRFPATGRTSTGQILQLIPSQAFMTYVQPGAPTDDGQMIVWIRVNRQGIPNTFFERVTHDVMCAYPINSTINTVANCDSFTFYGRECSTNDPFHYHYNLGRRYVHPQRAKALTLTASVNPRSAIFTDVNPDEHIRVPVTTGAITVTISSPNVIIPFDTDYITPTIDASSINGREMVVDAHSYPSGGNCQIGSDPPTVFPPRPIKLSTDRTTYKYQSPSSQYNGSFTLLLVCYKNKAVSTLTTTFNNQPGPPSTNTTDYNGNNQGSGHDFTGDVASWSDFTEALKDFFTFKWGNLHWSGILSGVGTAVGIVVALIVGFKIVMWAVGKFVTTSMKPKMT